MFKGEAYGYNKEDLTKRESLKIASIEKYINYLKTIAKEYPFLAIVGLRILTEIKIKDFLRGKDVEYNEQDTLCVLINRLSNSIPEAQMKTLRDFKEFENIASHGYEISQETAVWALDAIPAFLKTIVSN